MNLGRKSKSFYNETTKEEPIKGKDQKKPKKKVKKSLREKQTTIKKTNIKKVEIAQKIQGNPSPRNKFKNYINSFKMRYLNEPNSTRRTISPETQFKKKTQEEKLNNTDFPTLEQIAKNEKNYDFGLGNQNFISERRAYKKNKSGIFLYDEKLKLKKGKKKLSISPKKISETLMSYRFTGGYSSKTKDEKYENRVGDQSVQIGNVSKNVNKK